MIDLLFHVGPDNADMADEIAAYIEVLPEATAFPENVERFPPP